MSFTITAFLGWCASRQNGRSKVALAAFASVPLCLLAALRNECVGTDVLVYAKPVFDLALAHDFQTLSSSYYANWIEPLFRLLAVLVSFLTNDFAVFLGVIQLLTVAPVAFFLCKAAPRSIGLGLLVYSLTVFGFSLNGMRQSVAAAILLLSLLYLTERRYLRYVVLVFLAIGFHKTGLIGFTFAPCWWLLCQKNDLSKGKRCVSPFVWAVLLAILIVIALVVGDELVAVVSQLRDSFAFHRDHIGEGGLSVMALVVSGSALLIYIISSLHLERNPPLLSFLALMVFLFGALSQFSIISPGLDRVGTFFFIFLSGFAAVLAAEIRSAKLSVYFVLVPMCILYFVYVYVFGGAGEIYPYLFCR